MGGYVRRHRRLLLLQAVLTVGSITFLALRVDLDEALEQLTAVRLVWALPGLLAFTLTMGCQPKDSGSGDSAGSDDFYDTPWLGGIDPFCENPHDSGERRTAYGTKTRPKPQAASRW